MNCLNTASRQEDLLTVLRSRVGGEDSVDD